MSRGVYPPNSHDATLPLGLLLSAPLLFLPLPSPLLSRGSGGMTPRNFFELQMLIGEF